jgi:hypothetical protein
MNQMLGEQNKRLTDYLEEIQALRGMIPICTHCKGIRDDNGKWNSIEHYLTKEAKTDVSHSICPQCAEIYYPDLNLYDD